VWASWEPTITEARAVDEERVLLVCSFALEGKRSGAPVEQQLGIVMTVRDGMVVRTESYRSREEALEAVGMS
jgi:ketosteroid isomerase-like protein